MRRERRIKKVDNESQKYKSKIPKVCTVAFLGALRQEEGAGVKILLLEDALPSLCISLSHALRPLKVYLSYKFLIF